MLDRFAEDAERRLREQRTEVLDLQAEAQVGLVRSVLRDRFRVRHAPERPRNVDADLAEARRQRALDDLEHHRRRRKRHLEVHLRELELPIGAQRLVAEAARDLHVAIEAGDHQDLLEDLRRLRQRVELARMHARRHQEVARAFGRGLGQDRRLDLVEAVLVEVLAQRHRDAMAQADVVLQLRPAQIEIAILQPRLFRDVLILGDRERRRLGLVEDAHFLRAHFDLAGRQRPVHGVVRAALDLAEDGDDELGAHALDALEQRLVAFDDHLGQAVAIADVEEQQRAEVADAMHPSEQHDVACRRRRDEARHRCECARANLIVQPFPESSTSMNAPRWPRYSARLSSIFLTVTVPFASSSAPMTATNGMPRADAYLNCLSPHLLAVFARRFRIELHAQSGVAQLGRERQIEIGAVRKPLHHHHVGRRRHHRCRETCCARPSRRGCARGRARCRWPARSRRRTCPIRLS